MNAKERRNLRFRLSNARCGACNARKLGMWGEEPFCAGCAASGSSAWVPWNEFPFGREKQAKPT